MYMCLGVFPSFSFPTSSLSSAPIPGIIRHLFQEHLAQTPEEAPFRATCPSPSRCHMSGVGSGGSLDPQALVGQFYISATSSKNPDMDTGLRDFRPGIEVTPALLRDYKCTHLLLAPRACFLLSQCSTAGLFEKYLSYVGLTGSMERRHPINCHRWSGAPKTLVHVSSCSAFPSCNSLSFVCCKKSL